MSRDIFSLVRNNIQGLQPYEPHDFDNVIKLDANENPYPFPQEVKEKIYQEFNQIDMNRYPDPQSLRLREAIAKYTDLAKEEIIVGNGGDEVLQMLMLAFTGEGDEVLIAPPTFAVYKIAAAIAGAKTVEVPLNEDYSIDLEALLARVEQEKTKVTVLCTPNNPTGNLVSNEIVEAVCQRARGIVLVDEAYYEFGQETAKELIKKYNNLVLLRTFSKAFGLAGLRVGYILADKEVITQLNRVKMAYNMNSFSQTAARVVIENIQYFQPLIDKIIDARSWLSSELAQIPGIKVFPSRANYIFVRVEGDAADIHHQLVAEGVLVRFLGNGPGAVNCLRITIGQKEENQLLIEKLKKVMEKIN